MAAAKYDLLIEQGATWLRTLTLRDSDNALVNLTGYSARMSVRQKIESTTTLLDLTVANGRVALGGAAGTIILTLTAIETAALSFALAVYDIEMVSGAGVVTRLMNGRIALEKEVTR
jgi:hypothetical protein